jgi:hypothetical protein
VDISLNRLDFKLDFPPAPISSHLIDSDLYTVNRMSTSSEEKKTGRHYPLYSTIRIKKSTLERLQKRGVFGESTDEVLSRVLTQLQEFEKLGYEVSKENRSQ